MESDKPIITLPAAIIVAGVLVAAAIIGTRTGSRTTATVGDLSPTQSARPIQPVQIPIAPLSEHDHYRGSPTAPIVIVEFSDTECPFCKSFHATMRELLKEDDGKVAWVYRHAPILGLHKRAFREAEATECAGEQGGEDAFWNYLDELFLVTPSNDGLDPSELPEIAANIGLKKGKFINCLESGRHADKVQENLDDALAAGPGSTPWSVVMTRDGKVQFPLSGAQPLSAVKQVVEAVMLYAID